MTGIKTKGELMRHLKYIALFGVVSSFFYFTEPALLSRVKPKAQPTFFLTRRGKSSVENENEGSLRTAEIKRIRPAALAANNSIEPGSWGERMRIMLWKLWTPFLSQSDGNVAKIAFEKNIFQEKLKTIFDRYPGAPSTVYAHKNLNDIVSKNLYIPLGKSAQETDFVLSVLAEILSLETRAIREGKQVFYRGMDARIFMLFSLNAQLYERGNRRDVTVQPVVLRPFQLVHGTAAGAYSYAFEANLFSSKLGNNGPWAEAINPSTTINTATLLKDFFLYIRYEFGFRGEDLSTIKKPLLNMVSKYAGKGVLIQEIQGRARSDQTQTNIFYLDEKTAAYMNDHYAKDMNEFLRLLLSVKRKEGAEILKLKN